MSPAPTTPPPPTTHRSHNHDLSMYFLLPAQPRGLPWFMPWVPRAWPSQAGADADAACTTYSCIVLAQRAAHLAESEAGLGGRTGLAFYLTAYFHVPITPRHWWSPLSHSLAQIFTKCMAAALFPLKAGEICICVYVMQLASRPHRIQQASWLM